MGRFSAALMLGLSLLSGTSAWSAVDPLYRGEPQTPAYTDRDYLKYQLFVNCQPINLKIETASAEAQRVGWTLPRLRRVVASRLRAVDLYTDEFTPSHLLVRVREVSFGAMDVSVDFVKALRDPITDLPGFSMTWGSTIIIAPGEAQTYLPKAVSQLLDEFLNEYFRVNEPACDN